MKKILCICFSATYQRSVIFSNFKVDEVNRSKNYGLYASGKAVNSARVLNQLEKGCAVTVCPLGKENLAEFVELSKKDELQLSYVEVPGKIRECWTCLDDANKTTTELVVGENNKELWTADIAASCEIKMLKLINEQMEQVDAVLLAGSRQGVWNAEIYSTIAGMAEDKGKIFLADYIGTDLQQTVKACPSAIVKINDSEFISTFYPDEANVTESRLKELLVEKSLQITNTFVITRGVDSTFVAKNGQLEECPTEKVNVVNTTACGDSFNAGFLYEYLQTGDFAAALIKGTWCAARNAESVAPGSILH